MSTHSSLKLLILAGTLLAAGHAHAELYCVSTSAQLINAIASASGGGASEIRVRTGSYAFSPSGNAPALTIAETSDLEISGGWNAGCTQVIANTPDATVLTAQGQGRLLDVRILGNAPIEIGLTYLSFRGGVGSSFEGGCVHIDKHHSSTADALVRIDQNSFRLCTGQTTGTALRVDASGMQVRVRGNLFIDNASRDGAVWLLGLGNSTFYFSNNTVTGNVNQSNTLTSGVEVQVSQSDFVWLTNNVIWGNRSSTFAGYDLSTFAGPGFGNFNLVGRHFENSSSFTMSNRLSSDPLFLSSNNPQPSENSPLRNAGINSVVGGAMSTDLLRQPRIQGGRMDIGAFEFSELFANGFE